MRREETHATQADQSALVSGGSGRGLPGWSDVPELFRAGYLASPGLRYVQLRALYLSVSPTGKLLLASSDAPRFTVGAWRYQGPLTRGVRASSYENTWKFLLWL